MAKNNSVMKSTFIALWMPYTFCGECGYSEEIDLICVGANRELLTKKALEIVSKTKDKRLIEACLVIRPVELVQ